MFFNSSLLWDAKVSLRVLQHCSDVTVHKGLAFLLIFRLNLKTFFLDGSQIFAVNSVQQSF